MSRLAATEQSGLAVEHGLHMSVRQVGAHNKTAALMAVVGRVCTGWFQRLADLGPQATYVAAAAETPRYEGSLFMLYGARAL